MRYSMLILGLHALLLAPQDGGALAVTAASTSSSHLHPRVSISLPPSRRRRLHVFGSAFHVPRGGSTASTGDGASSSTAAAASPSVLSATSGSQESGGDAPGADDAAIVATIPPLEYNQTAAPVASAPLSDIVSTLRSNADTGLSPTVAKARLRQYGPNALVAPPGKTLLDLIAEQFEDRLVQILLAVAALSGVFSYFEVKSAGGGWGGTAQILRRALGHFGHPRSQCRRGRLAVQIGRGQFGGAEEASAQSRHGAAGWSMDRWHRRQ